MALLPGVTGPMSASGGCAPVSLVEIQTVSGAKYFWSEHQSTWNSILTGAPALFRDWLIGQQEFQLHGSTQTDTATLSVQNLSGNTVERDIALAYARQEFIGAFVYYRLWRADAETSIFTFMGNVSDAEIDDQTMNLTLDGFGNYSAIKAPSYTIDVSCPLFFGSVACGSTASVPCNQSYGSCSSIERFAGSVVQWNFANTNAPLVQIAQPAPVVAYNPARPF